MRKLPVVGALIVCLAGCGLEPSTPQLPPEPVEPKTPTQSRRHHPSDRTELRGELDAAQTYWNVKRPMAYELRVSLECFCLPSVPLVSRVTGATVVRSTGGYFDGSSWGPGTVELLFSEARQAINSEADDVAVEFDPRFRYPTRIRIDWWRGGFDDEAEWIAQLQVLR